MQVSSQTNHFASEDIYKASKGNLVVGKDGDIVLTPQGQNNISNAIDAKNAEIAQENQAQKDAQKDLAVDYLGAQSKKSQVEIYLAVALDNKADLKEDAKASIFETLRDVQKQNNAVQAYAAYQENQKGGKPALF